MMKTSSATNLQRISTKGETLAAVKALLIVPLFDEESSTDDKHGVTAWENLPLWTTTTTRTRLLSRQRRLLPLALRDYTARLLQSTENSRPEDWIVTRLVVVALYHAVLLAPKANEESQQANNHQEGVVTREDDADNNKPKQQQQQQQEEEESPLLDLARLVWRDVLQHASVCSYNDYNLDEWLALVQVTTRSCAFVSLPHPVAEYAQSQMPRLAATADQWTTVANILQLDNASSSSVLGLVKQAQEKYTPQPWAIVVPSNNSHGNNSDTDGIITMVQDCFPAESIVLDVDKNDNDASSIKVAFVANYDTTTSRLEQDDSRPTCCFRIDQVACVTDSLEDRVRKMRAALLPTCLCDRCRYEMEHDDDGYLGVDERLRLGHGYMALGDLNRAEILYRQIVKTENPQKWSSEQEADAFHALGAIALSRGKFLEAQRIWQSARETAQTTIRHHGLELQWNKLDGYHYLSRTEQFGTPQSLPDYTTIAPNVFVTPVLTSDMCDKIFAWANGATWTKQRHYAVPTCDVPVHHVEPLLSWFNNFMTTTMRPLLAHQFHTSPRYYVHDAFVVQYEAGEKSNHLPIHTDESTHSFIIALNDRYEGGGTYFYETDKVVKLRPGEILSFRGDSMAHGGEAVISGKRLIVAAFLYHDNEERIADSISPKKDSLACKRPLPPSKTIHKSKEAKPAFSFDFQIQTSYP